MRQRKERKREKKRTGRQKYPIAFSINHTCMAQNHCIHSLYWWFKFPVCVCAKSLQSCPTLCDPMDRSPPGSSVFKANHSLSSLVPLGSCFSSKSSSWIFNFHFFLATFCRLTLSLLLFLRFLIKDVYKLCLLFHLPFTLQANAVWIYL